MFKFVLGVITALSVAGVSGCKPVSQHEGMVMEEPTAVVQIDPALSAKDKEMVTQAIAKLKEECPVLNKAWVDMETIKATVTGNLHKSLAPLKWTRAVRLEMGVVVNTRFTPSDFKAPARTVTFLMGSGAHPGIAALTEPAQKYCGIQGAPKPGWMFREAGMGFVK
ncbi:MAG: hypothetical protein OEW12_08045 [Deltaproteobacteria bacterium]|nr:hypothetical protein [Deltaproteobacteria bacterium]